MVRFIGPHKKYLEAIAAVFLFPSKYFDTIPGVAMERAEVAIPNTKTAVNITANSLQKLIMANDAAFKVKDRAANFSMPI